MRVKYLSQLRTSQPLVNAPQQAAISQIEGTHSTQGEL